MEAVKWFRGRVVRGQKGRLKGALFPRKFGLASGFKVKITFIIKALWVIYFKPIGLASDAPQGAPRREVPWRMGA